MGADVVIRRSTALRHADAVQRLRAVVAARGLTEFAVFDHAEAAREAAQSLPGETVVVFGNPAVGTGLMRGDPAVGVELPLRVLVRETAEGAELIYMDPRRLADTFALDSQRGTLEALRSMLDTVTDAVVNESPAPA